MPEEPKPSEEEATQEKVVHTRIPLIRTRAEAPLVYYANDATVGHTKWEIQLSFGQLINPPFNPKQPPEHLSISHDVVVLITMDHARALAKTLSAHLEALEEERKEEQDGGISLSST